MADKIEEKEEDKEEAEEEAEEDDSSALTKEIILE